MKRSHLLAGVATVVMLAAPATAEVMTDPISVTSPSGDFGLRIRYRVALMHLGEVSTE